jgi:hypothetical protein
MPAPAVPVPVVARLPLLAEHATATTALIKPKAHAKRMFHVLVKARLGRTMESSKARAVAQENDAAN